MSVRITFYLLLLFFIIKPTIEEPSYQDTEESQECAVSSSRNTPQSAAWLKTEREFRKIFQLKSHSLWSNEERVIELIKAIINEPHSVLSPKCKNGLEVLVQGVINGTKWSYDSKY